MCFDVVGFARQLAAAGVVGAHPAWTGWPGAGPEREQKRAADAREVPAMETA